jgi:hypothetical protein
VRQPINQSSRPRPRELRRFRASGCRQAGQGGRPRLPLRRFRRSRGSPPSGVGSGQNRVRGRPRSRVSESLSCMAQRARVEAGGSRRRGRVQRLGADQLRPTRTTTAPRGPAEHSRGAGCLPPRCQVAPLVGLVRRVLVIGGVTCVHFCGSSTSEQCMKSLIDEGGIGDSGPYAARLAEELGVHGGAQPYAIHAMIMPLGRHG